MLMLETAERAIARGANILGEVVGFGMSADAGHVTQPSVEGPQRRWQRALRDARTEAGAVDYINAHGTGTAANDATETRAIRQVFGPHADRLQSVRPSPCTARLGAAGALEAFATLMALREGCCRQP